MLYVQILYKIIYAENIFEMYEEYEENIFEMYDCCNTSYHSYAEINLPIRSNCLTTKQQQHFKNYFT